MAVICAQEAKFGSGPALQWGGSIQGRMALFLLCSHTDNRAYMLTPASPPLQTSSAVHPGLSAVTSITPVPSHTSVFIGSFMVNLDALSCYQAPQTLSGERIPARVLS